MAELNFPSIYGGMNNIIQSDKLSNEQCELIENVEYNETEKKFNINHKLSSTNLTSKKLFEVMYKGEKYLLSILDDKIILYKNLNDFAEKETITTSNKPISSIIYNSDGIIYACDNFAYLYDLNGSSVKLNNLNLYFKASLLFSEYNVGYIGYANNSIYTIPFSNIGNYAIKSFEISSKDGIKSNNIVSSPTLTKIQGCLLISSYGKLGILSGSNHLDSNYSGGYYFSSNSIKVDNSTIGLFAYIYNQDRSLFSIFNNFSSIKTYYYPSVDPYLMFGDISDKSILSFGSFYDMLYFSSNFYKCSIVVGCFVKKNNHPDQPTIATYDTTINVCLKFSDIVVSKEYSFKDKFDQFAGYTHAGYLTFSYKIFYYNKVIYIFNAVSIIHIINLAVDINKGISHFSNEIIYDEHAGTKYIDDVTQNDDTFFILTKDKTPAPNTNELIYKINTKHLFSPITFLETQNSRLIIGQHSSLFYSGVGDFQNWNIDTDGDALYLEVGYKDSGKIIDGKVFGDNIIVFKDNGYIYKVSGSYPNWIVTKIAETSKLTSNIFNYQGVLIFGTVTGLKKLNPPNYYGELFLEDFQNSIIANNVTSISLSEKRKTLVFCSEDYVFEYIINLNIFIISQNKSYKQHIEYNKNLSEYEDVYLGNDNNIYKLDINTNNRVTIKRNLIHHQNDIVIRSITLFTSEIINDIEVTVYFDKNTSFKRVLKKGQTKHKFFITKRLRELQLKYIYVGNIFIENIIIDYINVKGV